MPTIDTKAPVTITFYGGVPPLVTGIDKESITFIDGDALADLFLVHAGVSIYHTHLDSEMVSDHWFGTEAGLDAESSDAFDARDIPEVPSGDAAKYEALFSEAEHPYTFEYKRLFAYAIDQGWILADGWEFPGVDPTAR